MNFEIIFYKNERGSSPIEEFLVKLAGINEILFNQTSKAIEKIKNKASHREPLSKHLESGLWELRVKAGTDILRILFTFEKGQRIIFLHIFIKKDQKTPAKELEIARRRLKELKGG
ncbi:type II toxin-antitoxin system RelE/ParE family toxin [Candidatus Daviesbacteria bacterium]|nr:type II toxin-antitoxin system RelE/ParE family toxin [Candidatus Daviesbacteria bacterium]